MNSNVCRWEEDCRNDKSFCEKCSRNEKNKDIQDNFKFYIPVCPYGYGDCINDPAHIKRFNPKWYLELYGDVTPEEALKNDDSCKCCKNGSEYDDECK